MKYHLELELSPSDVFELKRWVEEMRQRQIYDSKRYGVRMHDLDNRLSLLEKIYKGLDHDAR